MNVGGSIEYNRILELEYETNINNNHFKELSYER